MRIPRWILLTAVAALSAAPATADEKEDDGWEVRLRPHVWFPAVDANTGTGDVSTGVDVSSSDVVT